MTDFIKKGAVGGHRWRALQGVIKTGFSDRFKTEIRRLPVDWSYLLLLIMLGIWLVVLSGCASSGRQVRQQTPEALKQVGYPKSVAVLPFANHTDQPGIEDFVRATFYSHMCPYPYRDIELQVIDRILQRNRVFDPEHLQEAPVKQLGRLLNCEAVVFGEVTEYRRIYAGLYSQMAVGASVQMWDTRTGRRIWADKHVARKHEGGIPLTLTDIPLIGFRSGMNLTETARVQTVDDLSRQLTGRIPIPGAAEAAIAHTGSKWQSMKKLTKPLHSSKYRSLKRLTRKDPIGAEPAINVTRVDFSPRPDRF